MKRKIIARILWIAVPVVLLLAIGAVGMQYYGLKTELTVEYGDPLPDAETIGRSGDRYAEDYGILPIGRHVIHVVRNGVSMPVRVQVSDTTAPTAEPRERTIFYGETLAPDKFVTKIRDAGVVSVSFSEPFDFDRYGDFPVTIVLKDAYGNQSTVESAVHIGVVTEGITLEAGSPAPETDVFLWKGVQAELLTPVTEEMLHHVGTYPIRFLLKNGQTPESYLTVVDTVPPKGIGTSLVVRPDEPLTPEMFIVRASDETDLTFSFAKAPDPADALPQDVTVRIADEGGNSTDIETSVVITRYEPATVEATDQPLSAEMTGSSDRFVPDPPFVPDKPGIYTVPVLVDGARDYVLITVVDTTPPVIRALPMEPRYANHPAAVEDCFAAEDLTGVTLSWSREPDWSVPGEQTVTARAIDSYGNVSECSGTITLLADTEPPVLYGVINRTSYVGEPVIYLAEVYAVDDVDGSTKIEVESDVQIDRAGTYHVVYTTADASGNTTSAECRFTLVNATVSEEELHALAKDVIDKIITDDMVTAEKMKAVFDYVRKQVDYVGRSDKTDWRKEAARGIRTGKGDCFTFYSVTRALLDELGVEYMSLTRLGGRTRHYWVIVNIGTGWYHFDPTLAPRHKHKCFMWTNEQCQVKPYFWRYDHSKYPEIATERFDYDEVVRLEKEGKLP